MCQTMKVCYTNIDVVVSFSVYIHVVSTLASSLIVPLSLLDRTPVLIAAEKGRTAVVEFLTEKFRASCSERTKDGSTLLHVASLNGHPDTALMLLRKGVPLHMPNKVITHLECNLEQST